MNCEHVYTFINPVRERDIRRALTILEQDGLIAFPTDSSWAAGCNPRSSKALERLRSLKPHHPKEQPFSLICSSISMAAGIAEIDQPGYRILKKALPGPYTFLLRSHRSLPKQLHDKRKIVGIRIPDSPLIMALVERYDFPIVATGFPSHDLQGQYLGPLHFGYEIAEHFSHTLDLILDLGEEVSGQETTIVSLADGAPEILRQGAGETSFL